MDINFNITVLLKQSSWISLDWWGFCLLSCQFADMVRLPIIQLETDAVAIFLIDRVWKGKMNFSLSPVFFLELWSHPVAACGPMKPIKKWGDWWDSKSYRSTETFGKRMKLLKLTESLTEYLPKCDPRGQQHPTAKTWVKLLSVYLCLLWSANLTLLPDSTNRAVLPDTTPGNYCR